MNKLNFEKTSIEKLPTPKNKRVVYHDVGGKKSVSGLCLLVQPVSGHRSFFWVKKVNGETVRQTLGKFPDFSVEQARMGATQFNTAAGDWKLRKFVGTNPFKHPDPLTLGTLYSRYYEVLKKTGASARRGPSTEKSLHDTQFLYDRFLNGWKDRKLDMVSVERVRELHKKITEANGPIIANRVVGLLRRCINWGKRKDLWHGENPAEKKIDLNPETSREVFVQPNEMQKLMQELDKERGFNWDLHDFVLLSLYCGQRKSNTLAMRWQQITISVTGNCTWNIPTTKNGKPHSVPLLPQAMMLLQDRMLRAMKDVPNDEQEEWKKEHPWVFPSGGKSGHIRDMKKSWKRLREAAGIPHVHVHDLRRTLGSYMAGANVSLTIIGKALGHDSLAATAIYARLQLDPVRDAMALAIAGMNAKKELSA